MHKPLNSKKSKTKKTKNKTIKMKAQTVHKVLFIGEDYI